MALKLRALGWLAAASAVALQELRDEVERLAGEVGTLRSHGEDLEARRKQDAEMLRDELAALADRFDKYTDRRYATVDDFAELQRRIDGKDADVEAVRLAIAAAA